MTFRLQGLLEIRVRAEEAAERALASARARREEIEEEQRRWDTKVERAQERCAQARTSASIEAPAHVADGQAQERYRQRLAHDARLAEQQARTFRQGPLAAAHGAEKEALRRLAEARRDREALETLAARETREQRRREERRTDDDASDQSAAAAHRRRSLDGDPES